jgi:hypothetical protein
VTLATFCSNCLFRFCEDPWLQIATYSERKEFTTRSGSAVQSSCWDGGCFPDDSRHFVPGYYRAVPPGPGPEGPSRDGLLKSTVSKASRLTLFNSANPR